MPITDSRVFEMSKVTNQVYASVMLKNCIKRNFGMAEDSIKVDTIVEQSGRKSCVRCDMTVGKFGAKVS